MKRYLLNLLVSPDQFINALFCGDPDETLSSRFGKRHPALARFVNTVFCDPLHCQRSKEPGEGSRAVSPNDRWQVYLLWFIPVVLLCVSL